MADISVLIEAGKATAAAPLGPALGPMGVNIGDIVNQINEKTKGYVGMKVPVKIAIDSLKNVEITIGSPPTSALIKKEIGIAKGSDNPKDSFVGNMTLDQVKNVAEMKMDSLVSYSLKSAMKEIIGTCNSLGITIDGKPAKQVQREIRHGGYSGYFEGLGEKGTEAISEADEKKDAIAEEDARSEQEKQDYLDAHPDEKAAEAAEEAAEAKVAEEGVKEAKDAKGAKGEVKKEGPKGEKPKEGQK